MLKRTSLVFLLCAAVPGAATTESAAPEPTDDVAVQLAGIGSKPCAYWLSGQRHQSEGLVWILGFWSGLNYVAVASDQGQSKATSAAMIAAVDKLCRREPSRALASAAWSAYIDLNRK